MSNNRRKNSLHDNETERESLLEAFHIIMAAPTNAMTAVTAPRPTEERATALLPEAVGLEEAADWVPVAVAVTADEAPDGWGA